MLKPTDLPKFADAHHAAELLLAQDAHEYAIVRNPAYVWPPYEIVPLAPRPSLPVDELRAVVCDMDGTTTTTEPLCLHSLEYMLRRMYDWEDRARWPGLDHERDHPHVIGNSTTRHIEYLIHAYDEKHVVREAYLRALLESILWTLGLGRDPGRHAEARAAAQRLGLAAALEAAKARELLASPELSLERIADYARDNAPRYAAAFRPGRGHDLVLGGIEIYYARYHQILRAIAGGEGDSLGERLLGRSGAHLIAPMPGVGLFLAVLHGLLMPEEAGKLFDEQAGTFFRVGHGDETDLARSRDAQPPPAAKAHFLRVVQCFRTRPAGVAVVTSSLRSEAEIVLKELFTVLRGEVAHWPLSPARRDELAAAFAGPEIYYDAIITASDATEIRLKPHRDLYSLALHRLGLGRSDLDKVLGLEDSESGTIAIRAAGIGLCVAVPFPETRGHNLAAAVKINHGGLPQLMFEEGFLLHSSQR